MMTKEALIKERKNNKGERKKLEKKKEKREWWSKLSRIRDIFLVGFQGKKKEGKN